MNDLTIKPILKLKGDVLAVEYNGDVPAEVELPPLSECPKYIQIQVKNIGTGTVIITPNKQYPADGDISDRGGIEAP